MSSTFAKIIVIGYGVIAEKVLRYVHDKASIYGYKTIYIEHEVHPFNLASKYALKQGINYQQIRDKHNLLQYLVDDKETITLIISANNNYLFPRELLDYNNITVINFHNALLPLYPGRNAPSWAIYDEEKLTGITWHYVIEQIDAGNIITQKSYTIPNNIKAYELVSILMDMAYISFQEFFISMLQGHCPSFRQNIPLNRRIYKSNEIPGNGKFKLDDDPMYIYRLLRSMDYGKNKVFPFPVTFVNNREFLVRRYKIVPKGEYIAKLSTIVLPFNAIEDLILYVKPEV